MTMRTLIFVLIFLAACSSAPSATNTAPPPTAAPTEDTPRPSSDDPVQAALEGATGWQCPADFSGQTLSIYNWSTYIAEDTIANFEALCAVTVEYNEFGSEEELLTAVREGDTDYDVIMPSNYAVSLLTSENLLSPLNLQNIPNFTSISETFVNPPYDANNQYSVPYQWGTLGIGYNITTTRLPITTWAGMFEYDGRVAWLNDGRLVLAIALNQLGYNPNTTNGGEINAARDYLIEHSANVVALHDDDGQEMIVNDMAEVVMEYSGDIFQIIADCACDDFVYAIPEEGTIIWVDNMAIVTTTEQQALAEAFIDYALEPQVGADISNFTSYASPNQIAINMGLVDEALLGNAAIYPSEEVTARMFFIESQEPDVEALYTQAWQEVVAAIES